MQGRNEIADLLGEAHLGRSCARALGIEPFPIRDGDGLGAEVEWCDELELELAKLAGEGTERDYTLAHLVGFLAEAELAVDLARAGEGNRWALMRAAGHARRAASPLPEIGLEETRAPRRD